MKNMLKSKTFIFLITFVLLSSLSGLVFAEESEVTQEATSSEIGEIIIETEEEITEEDLDIEVQSVLPGNPFYFVKEWSRGIQSFFAFNSTKKAELKLKFSNERLMELKEVVRLEKGSEVIEDCTKRYREEVEKIKAQTERIKEKTENNPDVDKFLQKYTNHQILHQKLLEKLEDQVPAESFEKIKEAREEHLERFGEVMANLEDRADQIEVKLEEGLENVKGNEYRDFKNLEILKRLEEKIPEKAKEAVKNVEGNTLRKLQGDLEKMSIEGQERFKEYLGELSGSKEIHLEILENLKQGVSSATESQVRLQLKEGLEEGREKIMTRIENQEKNGNCPVIEKTATGFCKEGRVIPERNEEGCLIRFRCIVPAETEDSGQESPSFIPNNPRHEGSGSSCITLWDPVCGEDGKTYSNSCWAGLSKVSVKYKGVCGSGNNAPFKSAPSSGNSTSKNQNNQ